MQQANFEAERRRWHEAGLQEYISESLDAVDEGETVVIPEGGCAVESHMPGSIWKIECASGDIVEEGATLAVIEAMKIEIPIIAPERMKVETITIEKGQTVKQDKCYLHWHQSLKPKRASILMLSLLCFGQMF